MILIQMYMFYNWPKKSTYDVQCILYLVFMHHTYVLIFILYSTHQSLYSSISYKILINFLHLYANESKQQLLKFKCIIYSWSSLFKCTQRPYLLISTSCICELSHWRHIRRYHRQAGGCLWGSMALYCPVPSKRKLP